MSDVQANDDAAVEGCAQERINGMIDHYETRRGEHRSEKLTESDVREIRRRRSDLRWKRKARSDKDSLVSIAREYGISPTTVSHIVHRRTWGHVE